MYLTLCYSVHISHFQKCKELVTLHIIWKKGKQRNNKWGNMPLHIRVRTIFRAVLFFTAIQITAYYNEREWGWLNSKDKIEKEYVDKHHEIRVYSLYLKNEEVLPESVGFVSFTDFEIGPYIEVHHTQQLRNLIKSIGGKNSKIIFNLDRSGIPKSETTLSSFFLRELAYENHIRSRKGLSKIEVYDYVSSKIVE